MGSECLRGIEIPRYGVVRRPLVHQLPSHVVEPFDGASEIAQQSVDQPTQR